MQKTILLLFLFLYCLLSAVPQNRVTRLFEYKPAPGQYINTQEFGIPQAANDMLSNEGKVVSLGSFGGYIIFGFEYPCVNDPLNPYGIDFTVFGNAFEGSSEPGVISVMQDMNGNGKPDDTWYEIAGSNHFHPLTKMDRTVTYYITDSRDVKWLIENGTSGLIRANSYHPQEYYPQKINFPDYPSDSVSFKSTMVAIEQEIVNQVIFRTIPPSFGYADCHTRKAGIGPDNPYTIEIAEGYGGDPVDISWAVDSTGNYVNLPSVDFIKISTGYLANSGLLGESSTEISSVVDVEPVTQSSGKDNLIEIYSFPDKLVKGDSVRIIASFFKKGRKSNTVFNYDVEDESVAVVSDDGTLKALKTGITDFIIGPDGFPDESISRTIQVVEPVKAEILNDFSSLFPGDTIILRTSVTDNTGNVLDEIDLDVSLDYDQIAKIIKLDDKIYLIALSPGEIKITVNVKGYQVQSTKNFKIYDQSGKASVYLTIKTGFQNLFPLQWIDVPVTGLNSVVENRKGEYSKAGRPTIAHVVAAGLQKSKVNYLFREKDESGSGLFLYSVENEGIFTYGWGGRTDPAAFARAWVARKNGRNYMTDFENIPVSPGDTVVLYHVADILKAWELILLLPSDDTYEKGSVLSVSASKILCSFDGSTVSESLPAVIPDHQIQFESEIGKFIRYTDEGGKAEYYPDEEFQLAIYSGANSILLRNFITAASVSFVEEKLVLYPNPASDELFVKGNMKKGSYWRITDVSGRVLLSGTVDGNPLIFKLIALPAGIYLFQCQDNRNIKTLPFVKK